MSDGTGHEHLKTMGAALASGQDWGQIGNLALAFGLSAIIGLERSAAA